MRSGARQFPRAALHPRCALRCGEPASQKKNRAREAAFLQSAFPIACGGEKTPREVTIKAKKLF